MLITVEGIDGSGKSAVCTAMGESFPDAVMTREPTNSWYGEAVRRSINTDSADPLAELFLYTADHADHLSRVIRPALANGDLVISDRYSDSRFAYQGVSIAEHLDEPIQFIQRIHEPWTRPPDLTIYLDVSPSVGARRSDGSNKFEQVDYLERVVACYETLIEADPGRFYRIDAEQSLKDVIHETEATIETALTDHMT